MTADHDGDSPQTLQAIADELNTLEVPTGRGAVAAVERGERRGVQAPPSEAPAAGASRASLPAPSCSGRGVSATPPPWETTSQKWRCAFLVGTLLLAAGAASEGRWASTIAWLFFAGIWALLILLEWKKRNQP